MFRPTDGSDLDRTSTRNT